MTLGAICHACYECKLRQGVVVVLVKLKNKLTNGNLTEQVARNKSSLLLKIQKQNTQTLQLFTKIMKV
jgi:hypothetical protein